MQKCTAFDLHFVLEIFRFRLRNAVVQTARNISQRRNLTSNSPMTVHAVMRCIFYLLEIRTSRTSQGLKSRGINLKLFTTPRLTSSLLS